MRSSAMSRTWRTSMADRDDYPREPIGGGNPYWRCKLCGRSTPEISTSGHLSHCTWDKQCDEADDLARLRAENAVLRGALERIVKIADPDGQPRERTLRLRTIREIALATPSVSTGSGGRTAE